MQLFLAWLFSLSLVILSFTYHFGIFYKLPSDHALRWIKNNLGCTLFTLILLPIAVWIFTKNFPLILFQKKIYIIVAVILILITFLIITLGVIEDITKSSHRIFLPYHLKENTNDCLIKEKTLRQKAWDSLIEGGNSNYLEYEQQRLSIRNQYKNYISSIVNFETIGSLFKYGSFVVKLEFFINLIGGYFVNIYFIISALSLVQLKKIENLDSIDKKNLVVTILVVYIILSIWLILRLYSEWYINFYSFQFIPGYNLFTIALLLTFSATSIGLFFFLKNPLELGGIITTIIPIIIALLTQYKPAIASQLFSLAKKTIDQLSPLFYLLILIIIFFTLIIIINLNIIV